MQRGREARQSGTEGRFKGRGKLTFCRGGHLTMSLSAESKVGVSGGNKLIHGVCVIDERMFGDCWAAQDVGLDHAGTSGREMIAGGI